MSTRRRPTANRRPERCPFSPSTSNPSSIPFRTKPRAACNEPGACTTGTCDVAAPILRATGASEGIAKAVPCPPIRDKSENYQAVRMASQPCPGNTALVDPQSLACEAWGRRPGSETLNYLSKDKTMEIAGSHVLVVDDDMDFCQKLGDYLRKNSLRVTVVNTGKQMLELIAKEAIDLLLMEVDLPGEDGLALTKTFRDSSRLPMVVLSERDQEADRIVGLELGADDYVTKPFSPRELLARIRALLRRCKLDDDALERSPREGSPRAYRFAGWELNLNLARLCAPDSTRVVLSRGEFNLLRAFLSAPQRLLRRDQLLDLTRLHSEDVYNRSIDVQVLRLRRKLEVDDSRSQFIKTERGIGYYFDATVSTVR